MPASYEIDCPIAQTLDVIGERWTIMLLRDLFLQGPRRYQDFQENFPGISPNTLSDRLKKLENEGIVKREVYQTTPIDCQKTFLLPYKIVNFITEICNLQLPS